MSDIAFDGQSYYCTLCGKAGFESQFHAYGHIPRCKAKGLTPSPPTSVTPYPLTSSYRPPDPVTPYPLGHSGLEDRITKLERSVHNEMAHLRGVKQNDWSQILIWLGIAFVIGFVVAKVLSDEGKGRQIGDKVVNKVIDRGVTKVLGKVL